MEQLELEIRLQKLSKELEDSKLIPALIELSTKIGKRTHHKEFSDRTEADFEFQTNGFQVIYQTRGYDNKDLKVISLSSSKMVLEAKKVSRMNISNSLLYVNIDGNTVFEVSRYIIQEEWRKSILAAYDKLHQQVPKEALTDLEKRFPSIIDPVYIGDEQ